MTDTNNIMCDGVQSDDQDNNNDSDGIQSDAEDNNNNSDGIQNDKDNNEPIYYKPLETSQRQINTVKCDKCNIFLINII